MGALAYQQEPEEYLFRLGIVGFGAAAKTYCERAIVTALQDARLFRVTIFVNRDNVSATCWHSAQALMRSTDNLGLCCDSVSSIQPIARTRPDQPLFIVETSLDSYCFHDLYLADAGSALGLAPQAWQ